MYLEVQTAAIDGDGRVTIPASIRKQLSPANEVVVWRSFEGTYLDAADKAFVERSATKLDTLELAEGQREDFEYSFFAGAQVFRLETNGRFKLSEALRKHAVLEDQAAFAGLGNRFAIWSPKLLEARLDQAAPNAAIVLSKLRQK